MVRILTIPVPGWSGVRILIGTKDWFLLQIVQASSVVHQSYLRRFCATSRDYKGRGVKFTTDVYLVVRLGWGYTPTSSVCLHAVGIATGCGLDGLGDRIPVWAVVFLHESRLDLRHNQLPVVWVQGFFREG